MNSATIKRCPVCNLKLVEGDFFWVIVYCKRCQKLRRFDA